VLGLEALGKVGDRRSCSFLVAIAHRVLALVDPALEVLRLLAGRRD